MDLEETKDSVLGEGSRMGHDSGTITVVSARIPKLKE